jgi:hypothetical protein
VIEYQAKCEQLWLKWEFLQASLVRWSNNIAAFQRLY